MWENTVSYEQKEINLPHLANSICNSSKKESYIANE